MTEHGGGLHVPCGAGFAAGGFDDSHDDGRVKYCGFRVFITVNFV